jgi:hypothetical protein
VGAGTKAGHSVGVDLTDDECDLVLAGLFELRITHAEDDAKGAQSRRSSRSSAAAPTSLVGAYRHSHEDGPVPEYPADDTDEG